MPRLNEDQRNNNIGRLQDCHIRLRHLRDRFTTATSTAATIPGQRRISDQTVRNRLREAGIRARHPVKAVVLTRRHRKVRLQWVRTHIEYGHINAGEQFGSAVPVKTRRWKS